MSRQAGAEAERRVRRHYRLRGYRILDANAWAAGHELDLVVRRGTCLVFCEVKSKEAAGLGEPEEMVDAEKQRRLRRAAGAWLSAHPEVADLDVSMEVAVVHRGRVERIVDAF